jgi:hypothetical protein
MIIGYIENGDVIRHDPKPWTDMESSIPQILTIDRSDGTGDTSYAIVGPQDTKFDATLDATNGTMNILHGWFFLRGYLPRLQSDRVTITVFESSVSGDGDADFVFRDMAINEHIYCVHLASSTSVQVEPVDETSTKTVPAGMKVRTTWQKLTQPEEYTDKKHVDFVKKLEDWMDEVYMRVTDP